MFRNLTYGNAGDDYTSWSRSASIVESIGHDLVTIEHGSAYGDAAASVDYTNDNDFFLVKAAAGERYTFRMTRLTGYYAACVALWGIQPGASAPEILGFGDTCISDVSTLSYTVPLDSPHEWLLLDAYGNSGGTGAYRLEIDMADDYPDYSSTYPAWQDAFPLAVNHVARSGTLGRGDTDWFKVNLPELTSKATLEVRYTNVTGFTPRTWIYRGVTGSGGPDAFWVSPYRDGATVSWDVPAGAATSYHIRVGSKYPLQSGTYTISVKLKDKAGEIDEDWSSTANRHALAFGWGDMVADGLHDGDVDGFEVYLERLDRLTIDVVPDLFCDTAVTVRAPALEIPPYYNDYFGGQPFIWDQDNNGADMNEYGMGDSVTFAAARSGTYLIDIAAGPAGCSTSYRACFAIGLDEPASYFPPPFDKTPGP